MVFYTGLLFGVSKKDIQFSLIHSSVIEKLVLFKHGEFKVFYGGPVDRQEGKGVRWIMPLAFEDPQHKTRAVYEAAFVNCDLENAADAEILFIDVSDIDIKLKNLTNPGYALFSSLLGGERACSKYIVVRTADIANIYYPDIFLRCEDYTQKNNDRREILSFFHNHFKTKNEFICVYESAHDEQQIFEDDNSIIYKPKLVLIELNGQDCSFMVEKVIQKNDVWKVYYLISKSNQKENESTDSILLRIDSGCVSGQIYDDASCDCLDQLHDALSQMYRDGQHQGIIVHIPTHDGRGYGTAPKAETEIYKRGGKGRIHETEPLDTVAAARLLYGEENCYDLRTFDGVGKLLRDKHISKVILLTDNVEKVNALKNCGIEVSRLKTDTNKASCINHINAKKNSDLYFSE